ncbi:hypothetical protein, partial [Enterococcus mundtii]|uniref:hypothetical protein n=1 Tax=Enterococcus mundtii TaxID=53346 RepID=UPI001ED979C9
FFLPRKKKVQLLVEKIVFYMGIKKESTKFFKKFFVDSFLRYPKIPSGHLLSRHVGKEQESRL